jgi:hypothetical protein
MLKPLAYQLDCDSLLGFILDHDGGFGATPEEAPELQRVFDETAHLWQLEYGELRGACAASALQS